MVRVILFGLAAAVYPQLLAVVLVILALPGSRRLLWVCCLAGVITAVAVNAAILAVFRSRGTIAGVSESRLGPAAYLGIGAIAVLIAVLIGTAAGRALLTRGRRSAGRVAPDLQENPPAATARVELAEGPPQRSSRPSGPYAAFANLRARVDVALKDGSLVMAGITGTLLAAPGPFDFLAVGHLARQGRAWPSALLAIVVFAICKFALIEIPSLAYLANPDRTADRVASLSRAMQANKLVTLAAFVGLVGILLIGRGIAALA